MTRWNSRRSKRADFITMVKWARSSGLLALLRSSISFTGSSTARPKAFFQTRLAMLVAKRGFCELTIHAAN